MSLKMSMTMSGIPHNKFKRSTKTRVIGATRIEMIASIITKLRYSFSLKNLLYSWVPTKKQAKVSIVSMEKVNLLIPTTSSRKKY